MNRKQLIDGFHHRQLMSGNDAEGFYLSGWSTKKSQRDRFEALLRASRFSGGSVVDYGCGSGDLFGYMNSLDFEFDYIGLDQNKEMVDAARSKYGSHFKVIEIDEVDFGSPDYVFASGVFQFQDEENPKYYVELIEELFLSCNSAISVNLLSNNRSDINKVFNELYIDPVEAIIISQGISRFWNIDHSYHLGSGDMTIGLHKLSMDGEWQRPKVTVP